MLLSKVCGKSLSRRRSFAGQSGKREANSLVQAGDEVLELVPEACAHSLTAAADLGCCHCVCYLLHQALPTALHHFHQICNARM